MFAGRPIIGLSGGIGSGKSFVASIFSELGCCVIDSDAQVREAYNDVEIRKALVSWWGENVLTGPGTVNRPFIASRVFSDPAQRLRLEELIHPWVAIARRNAMQQAAQAAGTLAFVWDTPLLFEAGLNRECDALVFVDSPLETRLQRVQKSRGWNAAELARRENLQWPLDKKREISDYVITNTADAENVRNQVRHVLSRILARTKQMSGLE
jgi:dephospho-CoA kinase